MHVWWCRHCSSVSLGCTITWFHRDHCQMLIQFGCCQPELECSWHTGDETVCLSWDILHVIAFVHMDIYMSILTHLHAERNLECRKTENELEWYKMEGKTKHHSLWFFPCSQCSAGRDFLFSALIWSFVHLLSQALARRCSDWIAHFSPACCSPWWCFHLLPTPPLCQSVWLRKRTDRRCRKTRCISFAFESVKELFLYLTHLTLAFILLDAFVTLIINDQQRQILLLLYHSLSLLCRSSTEISVSHVRVWSWKRYGSSVSASGFV